MTSPSTRWVRDVPSDPAMTTQWAQQAIPWCITHDAIAIHPIPGTVCRVGVDRSDHGTCTISQGGPDHKWWRDV